MAPLALFIWPLVALGLFAALGPQRGLIWATVVGALFLPEAYGIDVPGLPPYNKWTAIALGTIIGLLITRSRLPKVMGDSETNRFARRVFISMAVLLYVTPIMTILTNARPLVFIETTLPGLNFRDFISMTSESTMFLVPFFAAWLCLSDETSQRYLLKVTVAVGLLYSLLVLFEIRMSPQLHYWVYGYFQHDWHQHLRGGGFRPIVFMEHGIHVGFFLFMVVVAAAALFRDTSLQAVERSRYLLVAVWMFLVLAASHNLGALALGVALVPLMLFAPQYLQILIGVSVAWLLLLYPAVRDLLPLSAVVDFFAGISTERGSSLQYRINHEDALLARANEKPFAGWGLWARWRIYDELGNDLSTVDGLWIGTFGERGWLGYVPFFGIFCFPLMLIWRIRRRTVLGTPTVALVIILAGHLVYMIPNAVGSLIPWLVAGAVAGRTRYFRTAAHGETGSTQGAVRGTAQYTRFPDGAASSSLARKNSEPQRMRLPAASLSRRQGPSYRR